MSAMQEELITETEAARYLGVSPERLRAFASQGMLQEVIVEVRDQRLTMYYTSEVLRLKERLRGLKDNSATDEWPEFIGQ